MRLHSFGKLDELVAMIAELKTEEEQRDLLSLRNGLLCYAALRNERCREMDICFDGFDHFQQNYLYLC